MTNNHKLLKLKIADQEIAIMQRKDMFCVSLDTVLLINFVKIKNQNKTLIDFGTNNGAIAILLAKKYPISVLGLEIQKEAVDLAIKNVKLNNLTKQVTILHTDIKVYAQTNASSANKKVDIIVFNPPFFPLLEKTKVKNEVLKVAARHEVYIDLKTIISSAANLLKVKGKFFIIYNSERLEDLFIFLNQYHFSVKRLRIVYPKINKKASLVLIEAVFRTKSGLIIEEPLICHN